MLTYGRFRIELASAPVGVLASVYDEEGLICAIGERDAQTAVFAALAAAQSGCEVVMAETPVSPTFDQLWSIIADEGVTDPTLT
jgi:hypothetical protein